MKRTLTTHDVEISWEMQYVKDGQDVPESVAKTYLTSVDIPAGANAGLDAIASSLKVSIELSKELQQAFAEKRRVLFMLIPVVFEPVKPEVKTGLTAGDGSE